MARSWRSSPRSGSGCTSTTSTSRVRRSRGRKRQRVRAALAAHTRHRGPRRAVLHLDDRAHRSRICRGRSGSSRCVLRIAFVILLASVSSRLARTATSRRCAPCTSSTCPSRCPTRRSPTRARRSNKGSIKARRTRSFASSRSRASARRADGRRRDQECPSSSATRRSSGATGDKAPKEQKKLGRDAATDIARALQLAYGLYPAGYLRRAVVFTDGVQTDGDLLAEANRAREFGVKLYTERVQTSGARRGRAARAPRARQGARRRAVRAPREHLLESRAEGEGHAQARRGDQRARRHAHDRSQGGRQRRHVQERRARRGRGHLRSRR